MAQTEFEIGRMWKLRRGAEAAMDRVELLLQLDARFIEYRRLNHCSGIGRTRLDPLQCLLYGSVLLADFLAVGVIVVGDFSQDVDKCRHAVFSLLGKISSAEKGRVVIRRQEHGQRPAARAL